MEWARQIYWPGVLAIIGGGVAGLIVVEFAIHDHPILAVLAFVLGFIPPAIGHLLGHYMNEWLGVNSPERIAAWLEKHREKQPPDAS